MAERQNLVVIECVSGHKDFYGPDERGARSLDEPPLVEVACWSHNLESAFMWSGGPGPRRWPVATAGGTPDNSRRRVAVPVQIPLRTLSSAEAYVSNQEWRDARLSNCPSHPLGGGSFARHGSYTRVTPQGLRIARWYCPEGRRTFSLLPDFVAARLPGLLASIDDSITVASSAKSMEVAA